MGSCPVLVAAAACGGGGAGVSRDANPPPDDGAGDAVVSDGMVDGADYAHPTGPYFTTSMFWNRDVSAVPKSQTSDAMIAALVSEGGWGNANKMQIDFSIEVLTADATTPMRTFTPTAAFSSPHCDHVALP